jgi:hypothetical protein
MSHFIKDSFKQLSALDPAVEQKMVATTKWAKYLSYVIIFVSVLGGIQNIVLVQDYSQAGYGAFNHSADGRFIFTVFVGVLMNILLFVAAIRSLYFSAQIALAFKTRTEPMLTRGLRNLKQAFIAMAAAVVLYAISFVFQQFSF